MISMSKYQSNITIQTLNRYLDYLIDPSFQTINRFFVLSFENDTDRRSYKEQFLPWTKFF